jgi:hypothetical protein
VSPQAFSWRLDRNRFRIARRREGRYLLRSNLATEDPATLWRDYLQLTARPPHARLCSGDLQGSPQSRSMGQPRHYPRTAEVGLGAGEQAALPIIASPALRGGAVQCGPSGQGTVGSSGAAAKAR